VSVAAQAGAVSVTLPLQVSVAVPLGPSVVTGAGGVPWLQGVAVVVPPVHVGGLGQGTVFETESPVTLLTASLF
jgi:hypothetical protein